MNSIESISLDHQAEWRVLPLCEKIRKSSQLSAVSFEGKVLLFGGHLAWQSKTLMKLNEEGEVEEDLSEEVLMPLYMGKCAFIVQRGKVVTFGNDRRGGEWKRVVNAFNGREWTFL